MLQYHISGGRSPDHLFKSKPVNYACATLVLFPGDESTTRLLLCYFCLVEGKDDRNKSVDYKKTKTVRQFP